VTHSHFAKDQISDKPQLFPTLEEVTAAADVLSSQEQGCLMRFIYHKDGQFGLYHAGSWRHSGWITPRNHLVKFSVRQTDGTWGSWLDLSLPM